MGNSPAYNRPTARAQELRQNASDAERLLWQQLSGRKLDGFKFSRQIPIGRFICDFICRMEKLVIELDGRQHDGQMEYDEFRTRQLELLGYRVLRFSNDEVFRNLEGVLMTIRAALPTPSPSRKREGDL
jgi:very-short-patch-repair endonuclease